MFPVFPSIPYFPSPPLCLSFQIVPFPERPDACSFIEFAMWLHGRIDVVDFERLLHRVVDRAVCDMYTELGLLLCDIGDGTGSDLLAYLSEPSSPTGKGDCLVHFWLGQVFYHFGQTSPFNWR